MPLIANHLPPVEHRDESTTVERSDTESLNDMSYESRKNIMEERIDDMERPMKALQPPALAPGAEKRVSMLLEGVMMDLQNMDVPENKESQITGRQSMASDPHEMYLSSEEDASESADEYEGSFLEFDGNGGPVSPASSRKSQEATARVVSITLVTKPQIVEITTHSNQSCRTHSSQNSIDSTLQPLDTVASRRRSNRSSSISGSRRYSLASTISSFISPQPTASITHPPRKSSKLANLPSLITKQTYPALNNDPFSAPEILERGYPLVPEWDTPIESPKTSLSRPTSAWKRSVKTLSRARYPSMPKMNLAYIASGAMPGDLRAARAAAKEEKEELDKRNEFMQDQCPAPAAPAEKKGPVKYGDIMKNAIKGPPPPPPSTSTSKGYGARLRFILTTFPGHESGPKSRRDYKALAPPNYTLGLSPRESWETSETFDRQFLDDQHPTTNTQRQSHQQLVEMATRPTVTILSADGTPSGATHPLPKVFASPIRPDIVQTVHTGVAKNKRQPYAVSEKAGHQTSAESWGTGRAVARIPRVSGGGTHRAGQAAFGNMCRSGRMFAPTKTWRRWNVKINLGQKRFATASALAASSVPALLLARGHQVSNVPEVPLVINSEVFSSASDDVDKVKASRKLRAGKGKLRGRRYRQRRGPLVVYDPAVDGKEIVTAFRNIPGVETSSVFVLNLLQLAPGGHLGRFIIWTSAAFKALDTIYGSTTQPSALKKDFLLPYPSIHQADIGRLINSSEIQSVIRAAKGDAKTKRSGVQKKNPLHNKQVLLRLNPYAAAYSKEKIGTKGLESGKPEQANKGLFAKVLAED
ncbi:hypothetical protein B7463_g2880, partial [Scytalidium lignicola]